MPQRSRHELVRPCIHEPALVAALAGATLVLGLVNWLLRERDDRIAADGLAPDGIE